ncbi:hypothetical protein [Anaerovorax odorimutans]|uniref:hypothetical protein n=1 Tax=Anaerovorax odorimutans TaxID=109327 RepID=UPI000408A2BE|nr:hypothetical protein [Anaerovorax odorimutans]
MIIKAAHIILSQMILCSSAVEAEHLKSCFFADLNPIDSDIDNYKNIKELFNKKNYFLQDFGKFNVYAHEKFSPFVLNLFSNESQPSKRKLLSTCYGCSGNFYFYIKEKGVYIKILPIIHIFPNKLVNIIYSCFIESKNENNFNILEIIKELKKGFLRDKETYLKLHCSKANYDFIEDFKDMTNCICRKIEKVMPEYDFFDADNFKHVFVQLLQTVNTKNSQVDDFNNNCFRNIAQILLNKPEIPEKHYSIQEYNQRYRYYDYNLIYPDFYLSAQNYAFTKDKRLIKQLRYYGWNLFSNIEFAMYDKLILQYITRKAIETQTIIRKEKHHILLSKLRPTYYNPSIDNLCLNQKYAFEQLNDFSRKIVYMFYGNKEKRNEILEDAINELEKSNSLIDTRENLWIKLFKQLFIN